MKENAKNDVSSVIRPRFIAVMPNANDLRRKMRPRFTVEQPRRKRWHRISTGVGVSFYKAENELDALSPCGVDIRQDETISFVSMRDSRHKFHGKWFYFESASLFFYFRLSSEDCQQKVWYIL